MTNTDTHPTDLPAGWIKVKHYEISGVNIKPDFHKVDDDSEVSFIPMAAVEEKTGSVNLDEVRRFKEVKKGYTRFVNGDIIFAKITPCMENGKVAVLSNLKNGIGFGSTEFHTSRFYGEINSQFYFYYFSQEAFRREAKREMTGSAGQLRVPSRYFKEVIIPLPPLAEQHRIVAKIEELFSDLDHSTAALEKARAQLKTYRQAVLKYAFEGKLTEKWRRQHTPPPAAELLARIRAERAQSRKPAKPLPPLAEVELAELPGLPEGWCWVRVQQAGEVKLGRQRSPQHHNGPFMRPYLRVANVFENRIDTSDILEMNFTPEEFKTYQLKYGDILLNEGQSLELVGRPAMYRDEVPGACFQNTLIRFRSYCPETIKFALYLFLFYLHTGKFRHIATITTSIAHLGANRFAELVIPFPSFAEQQAIVEEIEARLSVVDNLEQTIETALQQAEALRQSILKQAFAGQLVPQDPDDEPAAILLERIKNARGATDAKETNV